MGIRPTTWLAIFMFPAAAAYAVTETEAPPAAVQSDIPVSRDTGNDPFPRHDVLAEQVAFWRNVYGYWSMNQVALHDMEYPGIVYEVVDLPGPASEGYTTQQKKFIEDRREELQSRLRSLEQRYANPATLTDADRELLFRIHAGGGEQAVAGVSDRVRSQRGLRERFRRGLEISGRYDSTFRNIFNDAGLPEDLAYLPHVESSFQTNARSSAGAVGVWQFTRGAGKLFLKVNPVVDERLDPVASARGASRYLRRSYDVLQDWAFAITSYNHGVEGMLRAKRQVGDDFSRVVREYDSRSFGFASRNFYTEFLAARDVAGNHGEFFPEGVRFEPPMQAQTVMLDRKTSAVQLAKLYNVSLGELAAVNPAWSRRAARGDVPLPAGVEIWLPPAGNGNVASVAQASASVAQNSTSRSAPQIDADAAPTSRNYHVVRKRETLYQIAKRYDLTVSELRALNEIAPNDHVVKVGQKLLVVDSAKTEPSSVFVEARDEIVHIVRKGETAIEIAANYGVSLSELMATNDLQRHSVIYPGQRFRIPRQ
jgi:membrane-bound lytic murein transglycosylase D